MAQCHRNSGSLKNGMVAQAHRTSGSFAPRLFSLLDECEANTKKVCKKQLDEEQKQQQRMDWIKLCKERVWKVIGEKYSVTFDRRHNG